MKSLKRFAAVAAVVACAPVSAVTLYGDLALWTAATVPGTIVVEDFQGYAAGFSIVGRRLDKLPTVTLTSNLGSLNVINDPTRVNKLAFASTRVPGDASMMVANFSSPVSAASFEVLGYDGRAPSPAFLHLQMGDGTRMKIALARPVGERYESFFMGVVANDHLGLRRMAFQEAPLRDGTCCNPVGWDNLAVAVAVPEPSTYLLFSSGLLAVGWLRLRRRTRAS